MACSKFQAAKLVPSGAAARMENYEIILLNTPEVVIGNSKEGNSITSNSELVSAKQIIFRLDHEGSQWSVERVGINCVKLNGDCIGRQQQIAINHEDKLVLRAGRKVTYVFQLEDPVSATRNATRRRNSAIRPLASINTILPTGGAGVKNIVQDHELSHAKSALKLTEETVARLEREKRAAENRAAAVMTELQAKTIAKEAAEARLSALEQEMARLQADMNEALAAKDEATTSLMDRLKSALECTICTELVVGAVSLNCMHTFCQVCIGQWRTGSQGYCPVCRADIVFTAKNHTQDNIVDILVNNGMTEEQQDHRRALVRQREEALDANPGFRNLGTMAIFRVAETVPNSEEGLPLAITILEEHQRTREFLLRLQRERILRRHDAVAWPYGDANPQAENRDANQFLARAQQHREFLQLYQNRVELRQDLIRRYQELLERHAEFMVTQEPNARASQLSRECVQRHRERLQGHEQLLEDEGRLILQYEEMVRHYEDLAGVAQRLRQEEEAEEQLANAPARTDNEEPHRNPPVETQQPITLQVPLPDIRFRPVYSSTPMHQPESARIAGRQPTIQETRPSGQAGPNRRWPRPPTAPHRPNLRTTGSALLARLARQSTRAAPYEVNSRELRRRPVHPSGTRTNPAWRY